MFARLYASASMESAPFPAATGEERKPLRSTWNFAQESGVEGQEAVFLPPFHVEQMFHPLTPDARFLLPAILFSLGEKRMAAARHPAVQT